MGVDHKYLTGKAAAAFRESGMARFYDHETRTRKIIEKNRKAAARAMKKKRDGAERKP